MLARRRLRQKGVPAASERRRLRVCKRNEVGSIGKAGDVGCVFSNGGSQSDRWLRYRRSRTVARGGKAVLLYRCGEGGVGGSICSVGQVVWVSPERG